jgi:acyl carrier protein
MMKVERQDIIAAVRDAKVVSDPEKLRDEVKLSDQGIDSLGVFNILLVLGEKYGIEIPDSDVDQLTTIAVMIDYLNRRLA